MKKQSRREVLGSLAIAGAVSLWARSPLPVRSAPRSGNRLGMFIRLDQDPDKTLKLVADLGFRCCEIYTEEFADETAGALRRAMDRHAVDITAVFTMGPGPLGWDFYEGPATNGLVPREWRAARVARLKQASDWARRCGIPGIETHCGFIPENPNDPLYRETVEAIRDAAGHCRAHGQTFLYHAGAETAITLLRTIQDVGLDNQGVGLDTANGIMYATGHPVDALEIYGRHLRAVNAKDALWPTDPRRLGREVAIGQGKVDFPRLLRRLRELEYAGPIIIEREIGGPQQIEDIQKSKVFLEELLNRTA